MVFSGKDECNEKKKQFFDAVMKLHTLTGYKRENVKNP